MTTYAMETRGTQHVRPRPRVRVDEDRRPQAHPARRQAPLARPTQSGPGAMRHGGVSACTVAAPAPVRTVAAEPVWRLTSRGAAVMSGLFVAVMGSGLVTVVTQLLAVTA